MATHLSRFYNAAEKRAQHTPSFIWGPDGAESDVGGFEAFVETQKISSGDLAAGDTFGGNNAGGNGGIAISGTTIVVGASGQDTGGSAAGAAYVFTKSGSAWIQQQKIQATDKQASDFFGKCVDIDGDTIIVGADGEDTAASGAGAAYVFTRSAGVWSQQQKINGPAQTNANFGLKVAVDGDTAVVAAPFEDLNGTDAGAVYIYTRAAGVWTQQQKIQASDPRANAWFGWGGVDIDGDTLVVSAMGANGDGGFGALYVFTRTAGVWTQQQKLIPAGVSSSNFDEQSVSISGDTIVDGRGHNDIGGSNSGRAYVWFRTAGVWAEQQALSASDAGAGDQFGRSVAITGDTIVVGAYQYEGPGQENNMGGAYVFTRLDGVWTEQQIISPNTGHANAEDRFGMAVAIDELGEIIIVGAPNDNNVIGSIAGAAYVFESGASLPPSHSVSVAAYGLDTLSVHLSPDGLNMFVIDGNADLVNQFSLTTPWVLSSGVSFVRSFNLGAPGYFWGCTFKSDGTRMYVANPLSSPQAIYQWTLSTPWDVSTAVAAGTLNVSARDTLPLDLEISDDGFSLLFHGQTNKKIFCYTMTSAFDITTATYHSELAIGATIAGPQGFTMNSDGTRMFIGDANAQLLYVYSLATPWRPATGTFLEARTFGVPNARGLGIGGDNDEYIFFARNVEDLIHRMASGL